MRVTVTLKEAVYSVIEATLARRGVLRTLSGCQVRFPVRYARYFEPEYEAGNIEYIKSYINPGMVVLDIGAHIGLLSVIMAQLLGSEGRCFSFEPTPATFQILRKTIRFNDVEPTVEVLAMAVGDVTGEATFHITDVEGDNSNSLSAIRARGRGDRDIRVPVTTIDCFVKQKGLDRLDFMKIDAEGAEFSVLKGASSSLARFRPHAILALHPAAIRSCGHSLGQIWDFLVEQKYKVVYQGKAVDKEFFVSRSALFDVILLPEQ